MEVARKRVEVGPNPRIEGREKSDMNVVKLGTLLKTIMPRKIKIKKMIGIKKRLM